MQQTAYDMRISDWSSDVCSSYRVGAGGEARLHHGAADGPGLRLIGGGDVDQAVGERAGHDGLSLRSRILERPIVAWPQSREREHGPTVPRGPAARQRKAETPPHGDPASMPEPRPAARSRHAADVRPLRDAPPRTPHPHLPP